MLGLILASKVALKSYVLSTAAIADALSSARVRVLMNPGVSTVFPKSRKQY